MIRILFLSLIVILPHMTLAQCDKQRFEKIFEKEINDLQPESNAAYNLNYRYKKEQILPSWLINIPQTDSSFIFAVGISNPGLDSADAINSAILRAQIMASVLYKSTVQQFSSYYINERGVSVNVLYESYVRIISRPCINLQNYTIEKTYTNQYDETIVLLKFSTLHISKTDSEIVLTTYKNDFEETTTSDTEIVYELNYKNNDTILSQYQTMVCGSCIDVVYFENNEPIQMPIFNLHYTNSAVDTCSYNTLYYGLWRDVFQNTITAIIDEARNKPETVKKLGDNYNAKLHENLIQSVAQNNLSLRLKSIKLENNGIKVEFN